jgi:hypothetical protein
MQLADSGRKYRSRRGHLKTAAALGELTGASAAAGASPAIEAECICAVNTTGNKANTTLVTATVTSKRKKGIVREVMR